MSKQIKNTTIAASALMALLLAAWFLSVLPNGMAQNQSEIQLHYNSQEEWDALPEEEKRKIMEIRMERDTRTLLGIIKGSEAHRQQLEKHDRMRRETLRRSHNPNLEVD